MNVRKTLVINEPVDLLKFRPEQFGEVEILLHLRLMRKDFK
jgi:hypothetical protein